MTSPTKTVTGAELKVTLGALGLSPMWFANHMNVTMRTVVRWFDSNEVSHSAATNIELLRDRTDKELAKLLTGHGDDTVVLRTYRTDDEFTSKLGWPASWHRLLVFRAKEQLEAQGHTVEVRYK